MSVHRVSSRPTSAFTDAVASLRGARLRSELSLTEVPAPARIAPHGFALAGDVTRAGEELSTGRFILLHDPAGPAEWGGTFRVVTYARADLETELGADPLLGQVSWSWLQEGFEQAGAAISGLGGTVTRVLSESYGALADRPPSVDVEIRASWTPEPATNGTLDVLAHLHAWGILLCTVGGLPPLPDGVAVLGRRQH